MRTVVLLLALGASGTPAPTPKPTPGPTPAPSPTARAVLSRGAPAAQPADLSSVARKVKVDRSRADALFRQDGPVPTTAAPIGPTDGSASAAAGEKAVPTPSAEESSWRGRAASLRRNLEDAREERARTERNLPPGATSSEGTAQRETLLYRYQVRIDAAQAALDALADECRQSPACQPGWVR